MTENKAIEALRLINTSRVHPFYSLEEMAEVRDIAISALKEVQQYREIGTVEECREAVEKQKPMKVNEVHVDEYYCPACGSENCCDQGIVGDRYCPYCGQAIDENLEGMEDEEN